MQSPPLDSDGRAGVHPHPDNEGHIVTIFFVGVVV